MWNTRETAKAPAVTTALTILWTAGAARPTSAQGPEADPHGWYKAVRAEVEAVLETTLNTASENEAPAGLLAQFRLHLEGILANLDTEMNGKRKPQASDGWRLRDLGLTAAGRSIAANTPSLPTRISGMAETAGR